MPRTPQAGHAVRITGSRDVLVKEGSIGIVEGIVGLENAPDDEILVTFNFRAFRGSTIGLERTSCSASGGPAYYLKAGSLTPTNETVTVTFWRWKDGWPGRDNGEEYTLDVPLWEYQP